MMMKNRDDRFDLMDRETQYREKQVMLIDQDAKAMLKRFKDNIENIKSRFRLYNQLVQQKMDEEAEDVLRFQIVYLMSALDFYMHELYSYGLLKIFNKQGKKSFRYKEYRVPLSLVEVALYDGENITRHLKETFTEINSSFTYMHPNKIRELLNVIANGDEFDYIEERLKKISILKHQEQLESVLEKIYHRRNRISHQTDIEHGKELKNTISKDEVMRYTDIVSILVDELHQMVCS
jgi:RiboL-PSP-HEPN